MSQPRRAPSFTTNLFCGLALLSMTGCSRTPDRVADRFVDLYFVETDQARALDLTTGLARKKLGDELKLVEQVRRDIDHGAQKPTVFWTRRDLRVMGERANATYDITIQYGGDATRKNAMLSLEAIGGRWTVGNFTVAEGNLPAALPHRP